METLDDIAPRNVVNLTPHTVVVRARDGKEHTYEASGVVLRATSSRVPADWAVGGLCLRLPFKYDGLDNYDEALQLLVDCKTPIVSLQTAWPLRKVYDGVILVPDTNPDSAIRETDGPRKGQIVAVRFLTVYR